MSATYPARLEHFLKDLLRDTQTQHLPYLAVCGDQNVYFGGFCPLSYSYCYFYVKGMEEM